MSHLLTCDRCFQQYQAQDHLQGQSLQCPSCGGSLLPPPASSAPNPLLSKPAEVPRPKKRRRARSHRSVDWRTVFAWLGVGVVLTLGLLIAIPTVQAFRRGYQRGAAFTQGTDQWTTYSADKYGLSVALPANFIEEPSTMTSRNIPSTSVAAKHTNGVYIDIAMASNPNAPDWPGDLLGPENASEFSRPPANGLIVDTKFVPEGPYYEWSCAMSWGDSFAYITVFGEDRGKVDQMVERVRESLRFRLP